MTEASRFPDLFLTMPLAQPSRLAPPTYVVGDWTVAHAAGRLSRRGEVRAAEPKVMDLLRLLAAHPGEVVSREDLLASLWPGLTVGEDTLARTVFKLRRALDDDPRAPTYVETIPKRGYRLIARVGAAPAQPRRWAALAASLVLALTPLIWLAPPHASASQAVVDRAKDLYFQYTREDNEAALALYDRVLAENPDDAGALAGEATALVQRVVRWPNPPGGQSFDRTTLAEALASGRTRTPSARARLSQAEAKAQRAVALSPRDAWAHQALGLTLAAQGDMAGARRAYVRATELDPRAWGALINLGELLDLQGGRDLALPYYERAYAIMDAAAPDQAQRVRPWQPKLGVLVAERHRLQGDLGEAETWYRRVLDQTPYDPSAVSGLAGIYASTGRHAEARRLCSDLAARLETPPTCRRLLDRA
jgi:transcriptional activator of cad operon